jgi:hypothetical protein
VGKSRMRSLKIGEIEAEGLHVGKLKVMEQHRP